ncbi:MAG TPA: VCBS repeat-containing protein [Verrucomicrobiae bacterium]|nr:VCBS repeat-containing protein [Verrucomicrobiae bacterium]
MTQKAISKIYSICKAVSIRSRLASVNLNLDSHLKIQNGKAMNRKHRITAWLVLLRVSAFGFQLTTVFAQGVIFTTNVYDVGQRPVCVAPADVNGDGKLDLICANAGDNTVTVLTNNGSGFFGSNATLNVVSSPFSVIAIDVNGDGKLDLICANGGQFPNFDDRLTVFTNNCNGGFGSNATLTVGSYPVCVVAADVNGDGKMDLICANSRDDTLTVLTNNGSGGFGFNAILTVGKTPVCVVAADVNGDGKPDLICGNLIGSLTVLTNNGSGGFGSNATLTVGSYPFSVVAVNFNGNGKPDLICANEGDNTLTVLTNNGSGGFGSNATLNVGSSPYCVVAADVNGDGKPDLICANSGDHTLTVLTNNGSGGFGPNATLNVGSGPMDVVAADVNGDGKLDLICANNYDSTLTVLNNTTIFPPPNSTPSLTINLQGNNMRVSWPSASAGWSLQQNPNLTTSQWGPSGYGGYGISDDGTNKSLTMPSTPGNSFFRLLHP